MKETLKGILKNTIDEKKYIFKYPIISYRYYDQAKFLYISDEEIGKEYNVDEDIVRYNEEDSKGYTKKIYIVGGLFQKEKKEMYLELKKIREFAKENNIKEIALELPVKYVLENNIRELKKYGIKEIILSVISTEDEILEKNGLMYNYRDITKAVFKIAISFMRLSLSMIIGLSNDEKEEIIAIEKVRGLKPRSVIIMQNIILKGTENAKRFVRGNLKMLSVEENKNLLEDATRILVEKGIKDIVYLRGIQDDIITSKYLTGVIIKDIENEILTRMYYNYLFEKIKRLKVRNEYITIKINGDIVKYIKGKEDNNLNKIKELYYIKEIKIQNENNNKIGKKLEIVLDNEKD